MFHMCLSQLGVKETALLQSFKYLIKQNPGQIERACWNEISLKEKKKSITLIFACVYIKTFHLNPTDHKYVMNKTRPKDKN